MFEARVVTDMLTKADVDRLLHDKSTQSRVDTATKLSTQFRGTELTEDERRIAEDILRNMVQDAEVRVREALSLNLKESAVLPRDMAIALAHDVDSVALPILEFSKVLTDADLIEIVLTQNAARQIAIARRETVSSGVVDALVDSRNEEVVAEVVANNAAEMTEECMQLVLDTHGENERINGAMVHRAALPVTVAERLVTMVSEGLREYLVIRHDLLDNVAVDLILEARERATMGLLSEGAEQGDVRSLVRQLDENDRLTPSIILRALCKGDMAFFEASIARRAGIPVASARALVHDGGSLGLKSVFDAAKMPEVLFPAVRVAVKVVRESRENGEEVDAKRYNDILLERIVAEYEDLIDADDLGYLLGRLAQLTRAEAPAL